MVVIATSRKKFGKTTDDTYFADVYDEKHPKWNEYFEIRMYGAQYDEETKVLIAAKKQELNYDEIAADNANKLSFIITRVLMPCPSMLEKKLLIMPRCNAKHWSAVFVFNPSFIELAQLRGYKDTEECLQPCFFRYCSIITDGNRPVPSSDGNLWFLNLVYSYANHCKAETPPGAPMEWLAPFGRDRYNEEYELGDIKKLWGTPCFPSIRIHKKDVPNLPKQGHEDGWNCGFGLVATIAIIMRDIVGSSDKDRLSFLNTFQAAQADLDCCPTNGTECAMFLRAGLIKPLTANGKPELFWDNDDYLTTLRNEWFDVFDQLAELENVTIPRRVNPRSKVSLSYITTKSDRKFPLWLLQKPNAMPPSIESAAAAESMLQMSENQPSTSTGPLNAAFDAEADSTKSSPKNMQDNQPVDLPASTDVSNKVDPPLDPIIEDPASHTNPSNSSATIPSVAPNAANPPASTEVSNKKDPLFDPKTSGINSSNEPASSSDIIPSVNSNADDFPSTTNDDFLDTNAAAPSDDAFYNLGFHDEATKIAMFGQRELAGGTVNALEKIVSYATCKANNVLPSWIQPKMKPLRFDWHDLLEDQRTVFLGVLFSSDGNSSHAVAIHGGFIYDANEVVALPLCKDALDYCTSTEQKRSKFMEF